MTKVTELGLDYLWQSCYTCSKMVTKEGKETKMATENTKYKVTIRIVEQTVEARSEDEAISMAWENAMNDTNKLCKAKAEVC